MLQHVFARPRAPRNARHLAAAPARPSLSAAVAAHGTGARRAARRSVVVVAATGLVMTAGVTSSVAEPAVSPVAAAQAAPALETPAPLPEPVVTEALTVAADVPVTFARGESAAVTAPPPPPEPEPVVVEVTADEADAPAEEASDDEADADDSTSDDSSSDEGSDEASDAPDRDEDTSVSRSSSRSDDGADGSSDDDADESSDEGSSASSSAGSSVLDIAAQYVGTPYVYGGSTPSGFDCSGFTQHVFAQAGISLPRTAAQQGAQGQRVSRSEARPGDLAVVSDGSHVGIYAGGNQWYDSPRPGKSVSKRDMWTSDVYFVRY